MARQSKQIATRVAVQRRAGRSGCCNTSATDRQVLYHMISVIQGVISGNMCMISCVFLASALAQERRYDAGLTPSGASASGRSTLPAPYFSAGYLLAVPKRQESAAFLSSSTFLLARMPR